MPIDFNSIRKSAQKKKTKTSGKGFPDVNKDGKVTMKDVLIAKGVVPNKKK